MILCAGESLIDMLPGTTADNVDCLVPWPGGAVFNTAVALGRLGASAALLSGISRDQFGEQLIAALAASTAATDFTIRSERPTTLALLQLEDGQARYRFYDEASAGRMIDARDIPHIPDNVSVMFFGGISLASEPCGTVYEKLMLDQAARRVTMVDPNIRPEFIDDEGAYRARIGRMIAAADIVKMSDEDLRWLYGHGSVDRLAQEILHLGPKLVCITQGADGASGYTKSTKAQVPAPVVDVVDTVGAGDTYNAGLLAGLERAGALAKTSIADLDEGALSGAMQFAAAAAAVTVSRAGANPPWASEL